MPVIFSRGSKRITQPLIATNLSATMENELLYQIALTKLDKVGPVTAKNLVSYCGGVEPVFRASKKQLLQIPGIGEETANGILRQSVFAEAEKELNFVLKNDIQVLFFLDAAYPKRLKHYPDCPTLLYYKGNADLNASRIVSVVGTRKPTNYGVSVCQKLIEDLKPFQLMVVSGLAYGIDIAAHRKCLEAGIPTIGVMGNGLSKVYPSLHRKVAEQMIANGGLLTEFAHHLRPDREHFPMRNRVVAGLCDALVVVESKKKGGSMITADLANGYNKDVFAFPGRNTDECSEGCNLLIKSHQASLLEGAKDLAYIMRWDKQISSDSVQRSLFADLNSSQEQIVSLLLHHRELPIDQLTHHLQKPPSEMAAALLDLEFKGIVRTLPGKKYVLI